MPDDFPSSEDFTTLNKLTGDDLSAMRVNLTFAESPQRDVDIAIGYLTQVL